MFLGCNCEGVDDPEAAGLWLGQVGHPLVSSSTKKKAAEPQGLLGILPTLVPVGRLPQVSAFRQLPLTTQYIVVKNKKTTRSGIREPGEEET